MGIFGYLCLGYLSLRREWSMHDTGVLLTNIQSELDTDREAESSATRKVRQEDRIRRQAELSKLKDPFL